MFALLGFCTMAFFQSCSNSGVSTQGKTLQGTQTSRQYKTKGTHVFKGTQLEKNFYEQFCVQRDAPQTLSLIHI